MATFDSGGKPIPFELFVPTTAGLHPAVVVAYGTEGMGVINGFDAGTAIRDFASSLANRGFVVVLPHYFERTGTTPGFETVLPVFSQHRDKWLDTLGDCLAFAASRTTDVDATKLALLGFSLGGHLALRQAKRGTGLPVGAVVEFFAPISSLPGGLGGDIGKLPPVQLNHGTVDNVVLPTQCDELEGLLVAAGKVKNVDYERHDYPGQGHGFVGAAATEAQGNAADFLKKHLG